MVENIFTAKKQIAVFSLSDLDWGFTGASVCRRDTPPPSGVHQGQRSAHCRALSVAAPILMATNIAGLHEDQQALQEMWTYISDKLLEAIPLEPDAEVSGIMMDSLCRVRERERKKNKIKRKSERVIKNKKRWEGRTEGERVK